MPSNRAVRRPRRTFRTKLLVWMLLLVVTPTAVSIALFDQIVRRRIVEGHARDAELLVDTVAASLSGHGEDGLSRESGVLVRRLNQNPEIRFVIVADPDGDVAHAGVFNEEDWQAYVDRHNAVLARRRVEVTATEPEFLTDELVVYAADIPHPPSIDARARDDPPADPGRAGVVLVGLNRPSLTSELEQFQLAQVVCVALACLAAFPVVGFLARRWTRPLDELVAATERLGNGQEPDPIAVRTRDEFGYLGGAFNDMAGRLIAGRRALQNANAELEQRVAEKTAELRNAVCRLDTLASTDTLTGLANRRVLGERLDEYFAATKVSEKDLACLLIDMDGFKQVNDTLGHDAGDDILRLAAETLKQRVQGHKLPARTGGDEFVVLAPSFGPAEGAALAADLERDFAERLARSVKYAELAVSMSVGVATLKRDAPDDAEALLKQADAAMYAAKQARKAATSQARAA